MAKPIKQPKAAAAAGDGAAPAAASTANAGAGVPILSASKRVVERDAAEAAEREARKQAKLHRLQMKQRGHMVSGWGGRWLHPLHEHQASLLVKECPWALNQQDVCCVLMLSIAGVVQMFMSRWALHFQHAHCSSSITTNHM